MAAPTYSAGTVGNVFNGMSLAAGKNAAKLVDLSTVLGGAIECRIATGGTPPTASTTFSAFRVAGATAAGNTTLASNALNGTTTLVLQSSTVAARIYAGQKIAVIVAATGLGEIVTVSSVSGTTLTVSTLTNSYSTGDLVFLIEQVASGGSVAPGSSWAANSTYGGPSIVPYAAFVWILQAANADGTQPVTITGTLDTNPTFQ